MLANRPDKYQMSVDRGRGLVTLNFLRSITGVRMLTDYIDQQCLYMIFLIKIYEETV